MKVGDAKYLRDRGVPEETVDRIQKIQDIGLREDAIVRALLEVSILKK